VSWEITVSHEEIEGRTRLVIEADPNVPELVISALAASYWEEEVRLGDEWEDDEFDEFDDTIQGPGGLHG
jgi:hypothetical protein